MKYLVPLLLLTLAGTAQAQWNTNNIAWEAPTTCSSGQPIANCAVVNYRVERSATTTGAFATVGTSTTITFVHNGAVAGPNCYRVIAIAATGESVPSNVACKTNVEPAGPPSPPANLKVTSPVAWNVRPDYTRFAFVRGSRYGVVKVGAACDASRRTADGLYAVSRRTMVTPRPQESVVVVAACA